jgi:hypothetical protein
MFGVVRGWMNIVRVDTEEEYGEEVSAAAVKRVGETHYSLEISY